MHNKAGLTSFYINFQINNHYNKSLKNNCMIHCPFDDSGPILSSQCCYHVERRR